MTRRFNRIHAICTYLREERGSGPCKGCPAWHREPDMPGLWTPGCYRMAKEVLNIAQKGDPFNGRANKQTVRDWRRRMTVKPKPRLRVVK